jgi:TDG/mug DNA glycosylase family protein
MTSATGIAETASEALLRGFPPVHAADARWLVLGSFPGVASLQQLRYYGHPRNAFWPIIAELTGVAADAPYPRRIDALLRQRIALWDVLAGCERSGSLDAQIRNALPNDLTALFSASPQIERILLNGGTAARLFRQHQLPSLQGAGFAGSLHPLPSTSPANAGVPYAAKREAWLGALSS